MCFFTHRTKCKVKNASFTHQHCQSCTLKKTYAPSITALTFLVSPHLNMPTAGETHQFSAITRDKKFDFCWCQSVFSFTHQQPLHTPLPASHSRRSSCPSTLSSGSTLSLHTAESNRASAEGLPCKERMSARNNAQRNDRRFLKALT